MSSNKVFRVVNSTSLGYELYDEEKKSFLLSPNRKKITYHGEKILIGDYVRLDEQGMINEVLERNNFLKRPRLSNVDIALILISCKEPDFSSYLLDKFIAMIQYSQIKVSIVVTKADLLKKKEYEALSLRMQEYARIGYSVYFVDTHDEKKFDFARLLDDIKAKSIAFVGQTGVGKSSLINTIDPSFQRRVDALYVTSGRGRHTTKEIVLLPFGEGFLFDTPGFSEMELQDIKSEDLRNCFLNYSSYIDKCYFNDCKHQENAKGCALVSDLKDGVVNADSYKNYLKIMEEVKVNDLWKKKL